MARRLLRCMSPEMVVCHEYRRSVRRYATVRGSEGGRFEVGNQVLISSHRKLLLSKAIVVSVAETAGRDTVRCRRLDRPLSGRPLF